MKFLAIVMFLVCIVLSDDIINTLIVRDGSSVSSPNIDIKYNRGDYKHWTDLDNDCKNSRDEMLSMRNIDSIAPLIYTNNDKCKVKSGAWYDNYGDTIYTDPKKLDIDHLCPLFDVTISGAYTWNKDRKEMYANDLDNMYHLIITSAKLNRQKGGKSPDKWLPPNIAFREQYCLVWVRIKKKWQLTVTKNELDTLKHYLKNYQGLQYPRLR